MKSSDTAQPQSNEQKLRDLLHKVELLRQCPSLPNEVKQSLKSHEAVVQAEKLLKQGVEK